MDEILSDLSTPALVGAIQQNLYDLFWVLRGHWKQAVFDENRKLRRWWSPIPMGFVFNAAVSLLPPDGDEAALIGETIAFFQSRARQEFDWWLSPGLETSGWGRQLESRGFRYETDPPGMAMDLSTLPENIPLPVGLKISVVKDAELMKTWARTFSLGYQLPLDWETPLLDLMLASIHPAMTSYLATLDGHPVAASSLFLDAGVAGIYNVATVPEQRGKGIGAAMTLVPLLDARRMGYQAAILQASELGYQVYQRLGFKELCRMNHYHWAGI